MGNVIQNDRSKLHEPRLSVLEPHKESSITKTDTECGEIRRKAFGRCARLGSLYDIRTDKLLFGNVFDSDLPEDAIKKEDCFHSNIMCDTSNSWFSIFENLHAEGELKLSILAGLANIEANGKYLKIVNDNELIERVTLVSAYRTKLQKLKTGSEHVNRRINLNALKDKNATHVVTEIVWGANIFAVFDKRNSSNNVERSKSGELKVEIKKVVQGLNATGSIASQDRKILEDDKLSIRFSGDIELLNLPTSFSDAIAMIPEIAKEFKKQNHGLGVQIEFVLNSIKEVAQYVPRRLLAPQIETIAFMPTKESIIRSIEYAFDKILDNSRKINSYMETINSFRRHLPEDEISGAENDKLKMDNDVEKLRSELRMYLITLRTNAKEDVETEKHIGNLLSKHLQNGTSSKKKFLDAYGSLYKKCEIIRQCHELKIECPVLEGTVYEGDLTNQDMYVLRTSTKLQSDSSEEFNKRCMRFFQMRKDTRDENVRFVFLYYNGNKEGLMTTTIDLQRKNEKINVRLHTAIGGKRPLLEVQFSSYSTLISADYGSGAREQLATFRPNCGDGWFYLGPCATNSDEDPGQGVIVRELISNMLADITGWERIWDNSSLWNFKGYSVWRPVPPSPDFVVCGDFFVKSKDPPSKEQCKFLKAVRKIACANAFIGKQIWTESGTWATYDCSIWEISGTENSNLIIPGAFVATKGHNKPRSPVFALDTTRVVKS